jgi:hypothetical protein
MTIKVGIGVNVGVEVGEGFGVDVLEGGTGVEEGVRDIEGAGDSGAFTIKNTPVAMTNEAANSPIINPRLRYLIFVNYGLPRLECEDMILFLY